jgi:hypothetical protein
MPHEPQCTGLVRCRVCGEMKHALAFAVEPSCVNGLNGACRDCVRSQDKRRRRPVSPGKFRRQIDAFDELV